MKSKKLVSVAIVLAMLLSLFSMSVFADGSVARIGSTEYNSVAEAIAAVEDGDTIEVLADTTENLTYTVTRAALRNKTVTLTGDKTITGDSGDMPIYFGDFDFGNRAETDTLNVSGLTFSKNGGNYSVLFDALTATVTDVTINSVGNTGLSFANGAQAVIENVTVANTGYNKGTSYTWRDAALSVQGIGTGPSVLTVKSGTYTSENGYAVYVFTSGGTVNIEGGNFSGKIIAQIDRNTYNNDYNRSMIYISGGNFTNCELIESGAAGYAEIIITGGTFSTDPSAYVAEGYKAVDNGNGTYTVESRYVAQVGEVKYETLAGAIAAANEVGNVTVTLLKDYDMEANEPGYGWTTSYVAQGETVNRDNMIVISGNDITLDLGGYTLSNLYNNTFKVTGTNITFQNGEMTLGQLYYGEFNNGAITKVYTTPTYGSYIVYVKEATNFVVNDLTTFGGINVSASTATINNLSFSGLKFYAVCSQSGSEVTINNGTYSKAVPGAANYLFWIESGSVMNITGGNFIKGSASFRTGINPVVSGGTFDFDPSAYLAADYTAVNNGDGTWTVNSDYAAKIGDVKYATLEDAVEAAQDGDTVTLLADVNLNATLPINKNLTLNGNNKTITSVKGTGTYAPIEVADGAAGAPIAVSISDLTLNTTGYQDSIMSNADYAIDLTLTNVDINTDGAAVYSNGFSVAKIINCDFTRSGKYVTGKDAVYYSVINVGYSGEIEMTNGSLTANGGNGVGTFPSGGLVTLNNVDITVENNANFTANHALWARNEDQTTYPEYCRDSVIVVNSGNISGDLFITDKYPTGNAKNMYEVVISITGGTFDTDPSDYVADGYEAVDNGDGTYTVGKVEVGEYNETTTTEGYDVTYAVTKQVIDENDSNAVINTVTDCTVNVKAVTEDTVYAAETSDFFDNLNMDKVLENVVSYAADADDTINVEIKVVCNNPEVVDETITYEVHPEAIVTVNNNAPETVRIFNDALDENAVFTIRLDVPNVVAAAAITTGNIKVVHRSVGYEDETNVYPLQGVLDNYYVEFNVTHFSEFIVAANGSLFTGHSVTLNGYINLNFYLDLYENQVTTGTGTVVNFAWGDEYSDSYTVTTADYVEGRGYKATVKLPAAEMTYDITASVVINGVELEETDTYSVRQYADTILSSSPSAELENLVKAMLYYGAKAQLAFGSNLDSLANEDISYAPSATRDELLSGINEAIAAANNGARATNMRDFAEGIGADAYYSSSLVYLSGCTLRHYFVFANGANEEDFTDVKSDYYYYVDVTDIAAADLDKLQSFPVGGNTCFYSALDFVKAIIYNYDEESSFYNLAAATYWYNQAANAYFD